MSLLLQSRTFSTITKEAMSQDVIDSYIAMRAGEFSVTEFAAFRDVFNEPGPSAQGAVDVLNQ